MEGIVLGSEVFASPIAFTGGLILLAVLVGGVLLGYTAEEEKRGRRIEGLEEPLAMPREPEQVEKAKAHRAA